MEQGINYLVERQLSRLQGIERFGLWYGYAQYGVGMKDGIFNWRGDTRFQPYSSNTALQFNSGAFVKDALESLRIYGYDITSISTPQGLAGLNRLSAEDADFRALAQNVALLYQFGKLNLRSEVQNGKIDAMTFATAPSATDDQSAHTVATKLLPEFKMQFQESVDALAKHLKLELLPPEQRKEDGFTQRYSRSGVLLIQSTRQR